VQLRLSRLRESLFAFEAVLLVQRDKVFQPRLCARVQNLTGDLISSVPRRCRINPSLPATSSAA
jgi:hypothetical protein